MIPGLPDADALPRVAVASMNRTHEEELALVRELARLLEEGAEREATQQALADWVAHTRAHFERENRLMEAHGFPPYPVHAEEHARVLERLEAVERQWREQGDVETLRRFVLEEWPAWFLQHLQTMDRVTAQFLAPHVD